MNIPVQIDENSAEPLYAQIEKQLRSLIVTGQIAAGTLLPPFGSSQGRSAAASSPSGGSIRIWRTKACFVPGRERAPS